MTEPLVADDQHRVEDDYDMSCDVPEWRTREGWVLIKSVKVDARSQFMHRHYQRLVALNPAPAPPEELPADATPTPEPPRDNGRASRRITGGNGDRPAKRVLSLTQLIPNPEPEWFIEYRRVVFAEKVALLDENRKLKEQVKMASDGQLALQTYGGQKDLDLVRERVSLTPYGSTLDKTGRSMVAQLCWLMDWNPFFDVYAFPSNGRICVMPSYQKLLEIVKEKERINYDTRPMTPQERTDWGLQDKEVGFVTEITEVDMFLDFVKAGAGNQYSRIKGFGVWRPGNNVPSTWTPQLVAGKRSLRAALYKLSSYKIASKRLEQALMQAGALNVEETEDGFSFDAPAKPEMVDDPEFQAALLKADEKEGRIAEIAKKHQSETVTIIDQPAESSPAQPSIGQQADSMPAPTAPGIPAPHEPTPVVVEAPAPEASELDEYLGPRKTLQQAKAFIEAQGGTVMAPVIESEAKITQDEAAGVQPAAETPEVQPEQEVVTPEADKPAEAAAVVVCANCGLEAADPNSPFPALCKGCGDAEAVRQAKKDEARKGTKKS